MNKNIKQVADAIVNVQDHGGGCRCTQCQADYITIDQNPEIVSSLSSLIKANEKKANA